MQFHYKQRMYYTRVIDFIGRIDVTEKGVKAMRGKSRKSGADNSLEQAKKAISKRIHMLRHKDAIRAGHVFEDIEKAAVRYNMKPSKMIALCLSNGVLVTYGKAGQIQCDKTALERSLKYKDIDMRTFEIR